jgi:hypothetical protein
MANKPKTQKQVDAEVKALKEMMPNVQRFSMFGEDNWAKMDMVIRVLEEKMDMDDVQAWLDDEEADDRITDDQRSEFDSLAYDTVQWRDGSQVDYSPAAGWESLVQKKEEEPKCQTKKGTRQKAKGKR